MTSTDEQTSDLAEFSVAVGASAGGLEALERLFSSIPADLPMAFIVAQHLSPDHKSMMVELLAKRTKLTVAEAYDGAPLTKGTVYSVPPHANVVVSGGRLRLAGRAPPHSLNLPIDQLMLSLAQSYGERAIGIVLSGTGSDGRDGAIAIKAAGGTVFVQDPATASFDGMPREAIRTGVVDAILPAEEIARELERVGSDGKLLATLAHGAEPNEAFEHLVREVRGAIGFDLGFYKRSTLLRRLERRINAVGATSLEDYLPILEEDRDEARHLVAEMLINVTAFFRDRDVFDALEAVHLPDLRGHVGSEPMRVWVAGCATGEEAYSYAMLLAERNVEFKLFGTDIDDDALARATSGLYSEGDMAGVSPERRERFFVRREGAYEVDRELRKRVVFASHNVLADPPFTRVNMVSCRNLLIYLTPEAQRRAIDAFSFALRPEGLLVLGTSEVLGVRYDEFKTIDSHLKIFGRREGRRMGPTPVAPRLQAHAGPPVSTPSDEDQVTTAALRILTDRVAEAAVLVNEQMRLVRVYGNAGGLLQLSVGEPSLDVVSLLPESLRAVANVALHRAFAKTEEIALLAPEASSPVSTLRAIPFSLRSTGVRHALLVFESRGRSVEPSGERDEGHVAALERELHSARQSLQAAVEELETSNEELQATNEELLASNEELQATNEELQSVNEELHTVNVEHQARISELSETNADLDNLLNSTPVATLFLDEKLRVRRFNPAVNALFPLVETDRGRPLAHFTSELLAVPLAEGLESVLARAQAFEREVETGGGQRYWMRAVPHIGSQRRVCGVVLTFSNITSLHESKESQALLQGLIDVLPSNVAVLDDGGVIRFVNAAWIDFARANGGVGTSVGASYLEACHDVPEIRTALQAVLGGQRGFFECEFPCHSPQQKRWFLMHVQRTRDGRHTVVAHTDVTAARRGDMAAS